MFFIADNFMLDHALVRAVRDTEAEKPLKLRKLLKKLVQVWRWCPAA